MNPHFCRVGNRKPNLTKILPLRDLEQSYLNFMEQAYNVMHSDVSLSDTLFYEASRLKRLISSLKIKSNHFDAAF